MQVRLLKDVRAFFRGRGATRPLEPVFIPRGYIAQALGQELDGTLLVDVVAPVALLPGEWEEWHGPATQSALWDDEDQITDEDDEANKEDRGPRAVVAGVPPATD